MLSISGISELGEWVGRELGRSGWLEIDQRRIDLFAEATGDHQWIHTDPVRAGTGPYGATIAHGYLSLSLLPALAAGIYTVDGIGATVNYGLNKVRFPAPVPVGSRVRSTITLLALAEVRSGTQVTVLHTLELEGSTRPAVVAEQVRLMVA